MALTAGSPSVPGKKGARAQSSHASGVASAGAHAACLTMLKLTPLIAFFSIPCKRLFQAARIINEALGEFA